MNYRAPARELLLLTARERSSEDSSDAADSVDAVDAATDRTTPDLLPTPQTPQAESPTSSFDLVADELSVTEELFFDASSSGRGNAQSDALAQAIHGGGFDVLAGIGLSAAFFAAQLTAPLEKRRKNAFGEDDPAARYATAGT
jgi:hypothetical protein